MRQIRAIQALRWNYRWQGVCVVLGARVNAATLDALAEVEAERDVARKGTEDAIGELQYERKMRAENLRALWDAEAERDALRAALTNAANEAALRFTGEMLRLDDENRKLRTAILETLAYAPNGDPDCAHSAGDGTTGLCVHCGFNPALDRLDLAAEARP